jgi:CxxC motif-containing protein (DUF1111 family)
MGAAGLRAPIILWALTAGVAWAGGKATAPGSATRGEALFRREWEPDDRRAHGGDGLGPVFNDRSCVACHNLGGPGGAGRAAKNVDIVSVSFAPPARRTGNRAARAGGETDEKSPPAKPDLDEMATIHAGFATSRSVVLHRFGISPSYENWRRHLMTGDVHGPGSRRDQERRPLSPGLTSPLPEFAQHGSFRLQRSQRNSTALFGAGLIDSIPDGAIAAHANPLPPGGDSAASAAIASRRPAEVHGRVSLLKDGRIGRFGWKAQMASLDAFVLTACSVELGLEVPGHYQSGDPLGYGSRTSGLDLSKSECDDLIAYVRSLPAPVGRGPSNALGKKVFESIGCADCHAPKLGDVEEIYSDLLLHDMGDGLEDTGGYGSFVAHPSPGEVIPEPGSPATGGAEAGKGNPKQPPGAGRREWRTPPLWGVRDSAPNPQPSVIRG